MTLELLHHEYLEQHPNGLRYSAFCERYSDYRDRRRLSMRQHHIAGDKMFVDHLGKKPCLVSSSTGEVTEVELFVAVLGAFRGAGPACARERTTASTRVDSRARPRETHRTLCL